MPTFRITVVDPATEFAGYAHIELLMQTPSGFVGPVRTTESALEFEAAFEFREDRSGVLQPSGPMVQKQNDGRRFIYLAWLGTEGGTPRMFRRLKVFFDTSSGFPARVDEYSVQVHGKDRRGGPACARAQVVSDVWVHPT